jgi:beta-glucanase (GH16 family)
MAMSSKDSSISAVTAVLDRSTWDACFDDGFESGELDARRWIAQYLPQWSTPDRSTARYRLSQGVLRLLIEADQPSWRDEDGELRVSNIQTATFSGPVGSALGTHRHRGDLRVRTAVPTRLLFTPDGGLVEARLRAAADPTCMLAVWLVGVEDQSPDDSGEICIAELYGSAIGAQGSAVRSGIKAHNDPRLVDDMADVRLDIDATRWHTYSAAWSGEETRFYVDDRLVRVVQQGMTYPLQVMVDLFEFPTSGRRAPTAYPKSGEVAAVRGYRRRGVSTPAPTPAGSDR